MHQHSSRWQRVVLACAAFTTACVGGAAPEPSVRIEIVDSAGVELVHNLDARVDTQAVLLSERLQIGNVDGPEDEQFHQVTGIATDATGRIFVIDQGSLAIRIFDRQGRLVRRIGRRGGGPGEFTSIYQLFVWRDAVHAHDLRRLTGALFDTTGALLETYRSFLPDGSRIDAIGGSPHGWLVAHAPFMSNVAAEVDGAMTRVQRTIARVGARELTSLAATRHAADSLLRPIAVSTGARIFWQAGRDGLVRGNSPFFEPSGTYASDGRGWVYVASGWPYGIDVYDSAGTLVRRILRAHDSIPVSNALVAEVLRRAASHYDTVGASGATAARAWRLRAEYPRIGFVPVTRRLLVSGDGWLWVQRSDLEPDPAALQWSPGTTPQPLHWDVFDPDGRYRYTVRLPARFTLHAVRSDAVVGVLRDEFNVQYVVEYEVRPRAY